MITLFKRHQICPFSVIIFGLVLLLWKIRNCFHSEYPVRNLRLQDTTFSQSSYLFKSTIHYPACLNGTEIKVFQQTRTALVPFKTEKRENKLNSKLILLWSMYFKNNFSKDFYYFMPGKYTFQKYNCPYSNCIVTKNKNLLHKADAVLFHTSTFNIARMPKVHVNRQIWILYGLEAPHIAKPFWKDLDKTINWTMTYRDDSDVKVKYGYVCEDGLKDPSEQHRLRNYLHGKSRNIVWVVSNCRSQSGRERYVRELSKYVDVDIYGHCGNFTCVPRQSNVCYKRLAKVYKFYLSFENSLCKDYVTEKLFNVLNYDIVPVLFAGEGYLSKVPPNSFIDATQFEDPKNLASYIKVVGTNPILYNQYFEWKKRYKVHLDLWMCQLCHKLNTDSGIRVFEEGQLQKWWMTDASCHSWELLRGFHKLKI